MVQLEIEIKSPADKNAIYDLRNFLQQEIEGIDIHIKQQPAQEGQMSGSEVETVVLAMIHLAVTIPLEELYHHYLQPKIKEWIGFRKKSGDEKLGIVVAAKNEKENILAEENSNGSSRFFKNLRYNIDIEKTRAILIGNSEFDDSFSSIPPVKGNLEDFSALLSDKLHIGVPRDNIIIALNKSSTEIEEILLKNGKLPDTETLIVYYTGHGYRSDVNKLYLVARNTRKIDDDLLGGVDLDFIKNRIFKTSPAKQKILIIDACHSGIATQSDQMPMVPMDVEGTYVLASSPGDDVSYFDKNRPNTYFTGALIDLLKNGINNTNEMLSLNDMYEYAKNFFVQKNSPQQPAFKNYLNIPPSNFFIARNPAFSLDKWIKKATTLYESGKLKEASIETRQILKRFADNTEAQKLQQQCSDDLEFMENVREGDEAFYQLHDYYSAKKSYEEAYDLRKDMSVLGKIRKCETMLANKNEVTDEPLIKSFKDSDAYKEYKKLIEQGGYFTALQELLSVKSKYKNDSFLNEEIFNLEEKLKEWADPLNDPRLSKYFRLLKSNEYQQALGELQQQEAKDPLYPMYKELGTELKEKIKNSQKKTPPVPDVKKILKIAGAIGITLIAWLVLSKSKSKEESMSYQELTTMIGSDSDKALSILKKKSEEDDSANLYIGNYYKQNKKDWIAMGYYEKAFKLPAAHSAVGELYYNGTFFTDSVDHRIAVRYFKDAAEAGPDTTAYLSLGLIYLGKYNALYSISDWLFKNKTDGTNDGDEYLKETEKWFRLGANAGSAGCIYNLARLLYFTKKEYYAAFEWMKKAAELGYADCQTDLGYMYGVARGTSQNKPEALRWYKIAAEKDEPHAKCNLAAYYINGSDGLPQDCVKALELLKSVEANNPTLETPYGNLGYIYENGCPSSISPNLETAKYYYAKGARLGDDYSKKQCDRLKIDY